MAKRYSGSEVSVSVSGIPINSGRGDGEFVRIEKPDPTFLVKAGVDGEATFYDSRKNIHRVTLTVMQTSDANDILSALHNGDRLSPAGVGIVPLMVKDGLGRSVFVEAEARIEKLPDEAMAEEPGTLEWVFLCPNPQRHVGGN
jgi:hypothetical protein